MDKIDFIINNDYLLLYKNDINTVVKDEARRKIKKLNISTACLVNQRVITGILKYDINQKDNTTPLVQFVTL